MQIITEIKSIHSPKGVNDIVIGKTSLEEVLKHFDQNNQKYNE